jgi:hypothetical protein
MTDKIIPSSYSHLFLTISDNTLKNKQFMSVFEAWNYQMAVLIIIH